MTHVAVVASGPARPSGVTRLKITAKGPSGVSWQGELGVAGQVAWDEMVLPGLEDEPSLVIEVEVVGYDKALGALELAEVTVGQKKGGA